MPRIVLTPASTATDEQAERRQEYMESAAHGLRAERSRRLAALKSESGGIDLALEQYAVMDRGNVPEILLRGSAIRLDDPRQPLAEVPDADEAARTRSDRLKADWASRPSMSRIARRAGRAIPLLLTCTYVAHLEGQPGSSFENRHGVSNRAPGTTGPSWALLAGMSSVGEPRARRARMTRALDELVAADLVSLRGGRGKYERFALKSEDGSGHVYTVPGRSSTDCIRLPAVAFYNGWHLVLRPKEVVMLLAVYEGFRRHGRKHGDVALPRKVRAERYGISGEVYDSVHELVEFGLVDLIDPMPNRRRGKFNQAAAQRGKDPDASFAPQPYRFRPMPDGFSRPALEVVRTALESEALPPSFAYS